MPYPPKLTSLPQTKQDAFYHAVLPELLALARQLPWPFADQASSKLISPEGRDEVIRIIDVGLTAAGDAPDSPATPPATPPQPPQPPQPDHAT
jgi:hypothetical protein